MAIIFIYLDIHQKIEVIYLFGFFSKDEIVGDTGLAIPNATLYHFGILTSKMHNDWMRYVWENQK